MMTLSAKELGSRIAKARRGAGITQEALAKCLDLDRSAVAKIEKGLRKVDSLELLAISDAVGCSVESLLKQEPDLAVHFRDLSASHPRIKHELDWVKQFMANYAFLKDLTPDE